MPTGGLPCQRGGRREEPRVRAGSSPGMVASLTSESPKSKSLDGRREALKIAESRSYNRSCLFCGGTGLQSIFGGCCPGPQQAFGVEGPGSMRRALRLQTGGHGPASPHAILPPGEALSREWSCLSNIPLEMFQTPGVPVPWCALRPALRTVPIGASLPPGRHCSGRSAESRNRRPSTGFVRAGRRIPA